MSYRTLRVSDESAFDLARLLWMAERLNTREGNHPTNPIARQHEALARIIREHSAMIVGQVCHEPGFAELCAADWRCACGSSGLGKGGLLATPAGVRCHPCSIQPPTGAQKG